MVKQPMFLGKDLVHHPTEKTNKTWFRHMDPIYLTKIDKALLFLHCVLPETTLLTGMHSLTTSCLLSLARVGLRCEVPGYTH